MISSSGLSIGRPVSTWLATSIATAIKASSVVNMIACWRWVLLRKFASLPNTVLSIRLNHLWMKNRIGFSAT